MHHFMPLTEAEREEMLQAIGVNSIAELFEVIPAEIREKCDIKPRRALSEIELRQHFGKLGQENQAADTMTSFLGAGAYQRYVPSSVRAIIGRGDFFSAYTPYQPEVSQGTLQAIFEFQSTIAAVVGMPVVNASMYDGASSTAEALLMAQRVTRRNKVLLAESVHPNYRGVVDTYTQFWSLDKALLPFTESGAVDLSALDAALTEEHAAVVVQTPNFFGQMEDIEAIAEKAQAKGAMLIAVSADPMAFGVYASPGEQGADIFAGEAASMGLPLSYGGPYVGLFGARKKHVRLMPGRLCGKTVDERGKPGFVLTLSTREQHIRREKATSNICTNQGLCALAVAVYLSTVGKQGFTEIAKRNCQAGHYLRDRLAELDGYKPLFAGPMFNEFAMELPLPVEEWRRHAAEHGFLAGIALQPHYPDRFNERAALLCATELHTKETIDGFVEALRDLPVLAKA